MYHKPIREIGAMSTNLARGDSELRHHLVVMVVHSPDYVIYIYIDIGFDPSQDRYFYGSSTYQ